MIEIEEHYRVHKLPMLCALFTRNVFKKRSVIN